MPRRLARLNSLSRAQRADHRAKLAQGFAAGRDAEEVFGDPGSPLVEPGGGEGSPTRLEAAVEHVAVAEVLDQKSVGIAPVVEDLAAQDVPADSPRAVITEVGEVAAAGGHRVDVADLVGRMDVTVGRAQRQPQGVVIGRSLPAIAADEAHDRSAVALPGVVQEVADDHPEVIEVPVERLAVLGGLQHQMPEPLHPCRLARRALGDVDPLQFVPKVVLMRGLRRQGLQLVSAGHHTDRHTAGIDQVDRHAAE